MEYPLINGYRYSFASIALSVNGAKIQGFKEINYSSTLEPGSVRGNHAERLGRTRGDLEHEGSMTLYAEEAYELVRQLGDGFLEKTFDITVSYAEDGQQVRTDKLIGCKLNKIEASRAQGTDALENPFELDIMKIIWNGKDPLKNPLKK